MPRTLGSQRHEALRKFIKEKREKADLTQHELARLIRRSQSYVATIETGQRRIDVVELVELAAALGFDPQAALRLVKSIKSL
jgi:transcriptional regulator with XRE-family HTH domain